MDQLNAFLCQGKLYQSQILTRAGFEKISMFFQKDVINSTDDKITGYFHKAKEKLHAKTARWMLKELEEKGYRYEGDPNNLKIDIEQKPYLVKTKDKVVLADKLNFYRRLGSLYEERRLYDKALENYLMCNDLIETGEITDTSNEFLNLIYIKIQNAYYRLDKPSEEREFAIRLLERNISNDHKKKLFCRLIETSLALGDIQSVKEYYQKFRVNYPIPYKYENYFEFGGIALSRNYEEIALFFFEKCLEINLDDIAKKEELLKKIIPLYFTFGAYSKIITECENILRCCSKDMLFYFKNELAQAYVKEGNFNKGILLYQECYVLAENHNNPIQKVAVHGNLSDVYEQLVKYIDSIQESTKALKILDSLELAQYPDLNLRKGRISGNLGKACCRLGEGETGIAALKTYLELSQDSKDDQITANKFLGWAYEELHNQLIQKSQQEERTEKNNLEKNLEESVSALKQQLSQKNQEIEKLTTTIERYSAKKGKNIKKEKEEKEKEIENLKEQSEKADKQIKKTAKDEIKKIKSDLEQALKDNSNSLETAESYYRESLRIARESNSVLKEAEAIHNLGLLLYRLNKHEEAINKFNESLKNSISAEDKILSFTCLGRSQMALERYEDAESSFNSAIDILEKHVASTTIFEWSISLFEKWSLIYKNLEMCFLKQGKNDDALEISDKRKSFNLASWISKRVENVSSLKAQDMKKLAENLNTTFVVYSLVSFYDLEKINYYVDTLNENPTIHAWIITSDNIKHFKIDINDKKHLAHLDINKIFYNFPYHAISKESSQKEQAKILKKFNRRLATWYKILIQPIKETLNSLKGKDITYTFVPDSFLAHIPFGMLHQEQGNETYLKALIEQNAISIAPSLQVLFHLNQMEKSQPMHEQLAKSKINESGQPVSKTDQEIAAIGHTVVLAGFPQDGIKEKIEKAEEEIKSIEGVFKGKAAWAYKQGIVKKLVRESLTVANFKESIQKANWIHIACHATIENKPPHEPFSVFNGVFHLTPVDSDKGILDSKAISNIPIHADLVFMSACDSGRGNLMQEGSIGPVWSFLAAGAKSTIATYWPLNDSDTTVKASTEFYQTLVCKNSFQSKVKALQTAVLSVKQVGNPQEWGALYLSGLPR
ncbi:MAG: CHAT domain-containing tetratricopeptide repeat protein [Candidatus Rhabdochlamydia sp.]